MSKGYILAVDTEILDLEGLDGLSNRIGAMLNRDRGTALVRGGTIYPMDDGSTPPARIAILHFDSPAEARAIMDDPEFSTLQNERHRFAKSNVFIVEGVPNRTDPAPAGSKKGFCVVIDSVVDDRPALEGLSDRLRDVQENNGGTFLVRGGPIIPMNEDSIHPARITIAQFDSVADARALFTMPEIVALREERHQFATSSMFVVEGL